MTHSFEIEIIREDAVYTLEVEAKLITVDYNKCEQRWMVTQVIKTTDGINNAVVLNYHQQDALLATIPDLADKIRARLEDDAGRAAEDTVERNLANWAEGRVR